MFDCCGKRHDGHTQQQVWALRLLRLPTGPCGKPELADALAGAARGGWRIAAVSAALHPAGHWSEVRRRHCVRVRRHWRSRRQGAVHLRLVRAWMRAAYIHTFTCICAPLTSFRSPTPFLPACRDLFRKARLRNPVKFSKGICLSRSDQSRGAIRSCALISPIPRSHALSPSHPSPGSSSS